MVGHEQLPVELQTQIWRACEEEPNYITIEQIDGYCVDGTGPLIDDPRFPNDPPRNGRERYSITNSRPGVPVLLQVCRLSRAIHSERYVWMFQQRGIYYFNPRQDFLFLKNGRASFYWDFSASYWRDFGLVENLMILDTQDYYPGNLLPRHWYHDFASSLRFFCNVRTLVLELPYTYPMPFYELDYRERYQNAVLRYQHRLHITRCWVIRPGGVRIQPFVQPHLRLFLQTDVEMCYLARNHYVSYRAPQDVPRWATSSPSAPQHLSTLD